MAGHHTAPDGTRDPPSAVGHGQRRSWAPSGSSVLGAALGRALRREWTPAALPAGHTGPQHGYWRGPWARPGPVFSPRRSLWGRGLSLQPPGHILRSRAFAGHSGWASGRRACGRGLPLSLDGAPASCLLPSCPHTCSRSARGATVCSLRVTRHLRSSPLCPVSCLRGPCPASALSCVLPRRTASQPRLRPWLHLLLCFLCPQHLPLPLPTRSGCRVAPLSPASPAAVGRRSGPRLSALLPSTRPRSSLPRPPGRPQSRGRRAPSLCPFRPLLLDVTPARCCSSAHCLPSPVPSRALGSGFGSDPESSCAGTSTGWAGGDPGPSLPIPLVPHCE